MKENIQFLKSQIRKNFCILNPDQILTFPKDNPNQLSEEYRRYFESLRKNLESILHTVNTPFYASKAHVLVAEINSRNIERLKIDQTIKIGTDSSSLQRSSMKLVEETMEDPKERERALTSIYLQMVQLLKIEDLKNANQELLSQAIVMIAGALEVFFTDLFKEIFNRNPEAAAKFISSADNAKSYNRGYIHVEDLGKHEFDLRSRMGDLVLSGRGIDSIGFLQKISREVFGKTPNLNDRYLHQIFEKRHIIAHRRGIALDGRKILVDPNEIEIAMRRCMDLADDLAKLVIEFAS